MAINQILVKNLTSVPLPIDAKFNRYHLFSMILGAGKTFDLGSSADYPTVSRNATLQTLKTKGLISITYVPGSSDLAPMPGVPDTVGRAAAVIQHIHMTAGAGGSADDVVIYTANSPAMKILDAFVIVSTAVGGSSATLRTALAGGGSAVSTAFSCASTGVVRSTLASSPLVAAGSSLVIRRSDSGIAGDVMLVLANS